MGDFRALLIEQSGDEFVRKLVTRDLAELPEGDLLIDVRFSSLNYKDALSAIGNPGVTRKFPHTPGIDAAGLVLESSDARFAPGDEVLVTGFDLGMNTAGGFGQRIRVPADWAVPCPQGLGLRRSMILGTAGFTAAACVDKLQQAGALQDASAPVLVTGATGGVGCIAVMLLARLGHKVVAGTGKADRHDWLRQLGASEIISRDELREGSKSPLLAERWAAVIDTVGGEILFNAVKSLRYGGSAAICGLVDSPALPATVLPFILRHVNVLGVDSVQLPMAEKKRIWSLLAQPWHLDDLEQVAVPLTLAELPDAIDRILAGQMTGRGLLIHEAAAGG